MKAIDFPEYSRVRLPQFRNSYIGFERFNFERVLLPARKEWRFVHLPFGLEKSGVAVEEGVEGSFLRGRKITSNYHLLFVNIVYRIKNSFVIKVEFVMKVSGEMLCCFVLIVVTVRCDKGWIAERGNRLRVGSALYGCFRYI